MFYKDKNKNKGFIRTSFVLIIAIVGISFFVDIKSIIDSKFDSGRLKNNFQYLKTLSISAWKGYVSPSFHSIWNNFFEKEKKEDK